MDGLGNFAEEYKRATNLRWFGRKVRALPIERIIASKRHIRRPKDIAHLPLLEETLRLIRRISL